MSQIERLVKATCDIMFSDSHVRYDRDEVKAAISADEQKNGRLITDEELELLCLGDEDGDVTSTAELFPNLNAVLDKPFV